MADILVVDDDAAIRQLLTDVLEMEGHQVLTEPDGLSAVRRLECIRPDCIVLDVMMPGLDGYDVLRSIRALDGDAIPVIMLTAAAEPDTAVRAWGDGVDYFLAKPFKADQVLDLIDALLGDHLPIV
jgi:DNA-binding response OmpR family regulator